MIFTKKNNKKYLSLLLIEAFCKTAKNTVRLKKRRSDIEKQKKKP